MRKIILLLVFLLAFPALAFAWDGTVIKIHDGDTITVRATSDGEQVKIRLWGIDCPENGQTYGRQATEFMRKLLPVGSMVFMEDNGRDRYKRRVSIVRLPDGTVVQEELLKAGMAWVYDKYCKGCKDWYMVEKKARDAKVGLWSIQHSEPPWEWRKRKRNK